MAKRKNPSLDEFPSAEDLISEFLSRAVNPDFHGHMVDGRLVDGRHRYAGARMVAREQLLEDFSEAEIQVFIEYAKDAFRSVPGATRTNVTSQWVRGQHYLGQFGDNVFIQQINPRNRLNANHVATISVRADVADDVYASDEWEYQAQGPFGSGSTDYPVFQFRRTPPWELRRNPSEELGPNELFDELVSQLEWPEDAPTLLVDEERALAGRDPSDERAFAACDGQNVFVAPKLYDQPYHRYAAILMHEIAHAVLLQEGNEEHSEREADEMAELLFNEKISYDDEDVQTIGPGTSPRPEHLDS